MLMTSVGYPAEFLINNRDTDLQDKGDIICVRPDGFKWSDSEKPRVVKIKDMKYENAVKYEQSLTKEVPSKDDTKIMIQEMVKKRKYKISDVLFTGTKLDTSKISAFKITDIIEKTK